MDIELSIIVPVYNAEQYLENCIISILKQSFTKFELILIDDGSIDSSGKICDSFAAADDRIIVYHQENTGVSAARNIGLDRAKGKYIGFVDSDDWIDQDMYEILISNLEKYNADISICGTVWEHKDKIISSKKNKILIAKNDVMIESLLNTKIEDAIFVGTLWDKIYRRELFTNLRFNQNIHLSEDVLMTYDLFYKSNRIVYTFASKYHYRQRERNGFMIHYMDHFMEGLDVLSMIKEKVEVHFPKLGKMAFSNYAVFAINAGIILIVSDEKYKEKFIEIKNILIKNCFDIMTNGKIRFHEKKHLLLLLLPYLLSRKYFTLSEKRKKRRESKQYLY